MPALSSYNRSFRVMTIVSFSGFQDKACIIPAIIYCSCYHKHILLFCLITIQLHFIYYIWCHQHTFNYYTCSKLNQAQHDASILYLNCLNYSGGQESIAGKSRRCGASMPATLDHQPTMLLFLHQLSRHGCRAAEDAQLALWHPDQGSISQTYC